MKKKKSSKIQKKASKQIILIIGAILIASGGLYAMFGNRTAIGEGYEVTMYYDQY